MAKYKETSCTLRVFSPILFVRNNSKIFFHLQPQQNKQVKSSEVLQFCAGTPKIPLPKCGWDGQRAPGWTQIDIFYLNQFKRTLDQIASQMLKCFGGRQIVSQKNIKMKGYSGTCLFWADESGYLLCKEKEKSAFLGWSVAAFRKVEATITNHDIRTHDDPICRQVSCFYPAPSWESRVPFPQPSHPPHSRHPRHSRHPFPFQTYFPSFSQVRFPQPPASNEMEFLCMSHHLESSNGFLPFSKGESMWEERGYLLLLERAPILGECCSFP